MFDAVGGSGFYSLGKATKTGGMLVLDSALETQQTVMPPFDIFARDLTIRGFALPVLARDADKLTKLMKFIGSGLEDGTLKPVIARIFPFEEIVEAHRFLESGEQIGKIVVTL